MAVPVPPAMDATSAAELLEAARKGSADVLGALGGEPLLVVDLEAGRGGAPEVVPTWLPAVVIGVAGQAHAAMTVNGVDVAVTLGEPSAVPPRWVGTSDVENELRRLTERISIAPQASVAFSQVLRLGRPHDVEHGLLVESLAYSALQSGPEFHSWLARSRARRPVRRSEPATTVLVERRVDELAVTLSRPDVRNAVNAQLRDQLCDALTIACADTSVRRVHLRGAGRDFCSGGDLDEFGLHLDPLTGHLVRTVRSAARLMSAIGDRVTAHLHGACIGAGIELAAFAGRVLAAPDTQIRLPEIGMGLIPGAGGTVSIPNRIGRHRTAWLGLTGEGIDVSTALDWGLVDEAAPRPTAAP